MMFNHGFRYTRDAVILTISAPSEWPPKKNSIWIAGMNIDFSNPQGTPYPLSEDVREMCKGAVGYRGNI